MLISVRAVIFDVDDTLFDHRGSVLAALSNWLPDLPADTLAWRAFDDAVNVLDQLRDGGFITAVLTNGATAQQIAKVDRVGLRSQLSAVITSEELGVGKPDPRSYLGACERLAVEPGQTLHVGDRYDLDVLGARAAGPHGLHLDRTGELQSAPDRGITTLSELPRRITLQQPGSTEPGNGSFPRS